VVEEGDYTIEYYILKGINGGRRFRRDEPFIIVFSVYFILIFIF